MTITPATRPRTLVGRSGASTTMTMKATAHASSKTDTTRSRRSTCRDSDPATSTASSSLASGEMFTTGQLIVVTSSRLMPSGSWNDKIAIFRSGSSTTPPFSMQSASRRSAACRRSLMSLTPKLR